jgi:hypothetical protein
VTRERVLGGLAIAASLALALVMQARAPVGVPLYDGVVNVEPYRYLHPTGNQVGDPSSFESTPAVAGSVSPVFAAATEESPPQAQIVAMQDAFQVPAGTTALHVTIKPVDPVAPPTTGSIAGNVYRFTVTNQAGAPVQAKPCDACRSVVLRAPEGVTDGTVAVFTGGTWKPVATVHAGSVGMYQANPDGLGDFAIIAGGPAPTPTQQGASGGGGIDPLVFGGIALALFFAAVAVLFWYRRRPPPVPVARLGGQRGGRIPSKRKSPRRPPSGRSGS